MILLTRPDDLPAETKAALARLSPARILIAGGGGAVSAGVEAQLRAEGVVDGVVVERLGGQDRFAISLGRDR